MYMKYDPMVPISQIATIVSTQFTAEHLIFGLVGSNAECAYYYADETMHRRIGPAIKQMYFPFNKLSPIE
uniref:Uncharacterized protein n=1 Tax=Wuchereria bancrofti TaxID=6293 RepID=A0AAF5PUB2_WUCBA